MVNDDSHKECPFCHEPPEACVCPTDQICDRAINARDFVEKANKRLTELGIGTYDNGDMWCSYYYCEDDGTVWSNDFTNSVELEDWRAETDEHIESFANAYLED